MLIRDVLYKRGFSRPYLRCLSHNEADYVMREVHEGICGNHSGARSLVHKLIRAGYYWPTMLKDAQAYIKTCDKCQRFSNLIKQPSEELTPMTAPWPFAQWGLDIMGPFPTALRQLKISSSRYRLLHQVGGSRTPCHYHGEKHPYLCVEKHHLQIRNTEGARL